MAERFLVTGALGCIGAWTVKRLVDEGVPVWAYDLPGEPRRLRLIMSDDSLASVRFAEGDITDTGTFGRTVADHGITHVVHLAAFQVPFVKADPLQGLRVNMLGSAVVLETLHARKDQIKGYVYASSTAVYGPPNLYPPGSLAHDAPPMPMNLYGVHKQAGEGMARIYWQDYGVGSIGLRPCVVYGPGRDQGMTSTPTKAMLAAAAGRSYRISFSDTLVYQYADDAARAFICAARAGIQGATVYNLGGTSASVADVVRAIEAVAPEAKGTITVDPVEIGVTPEIDSSELEKVIGKAQWIPLQEGVRQTIAMLRAGIQAGKLDVDRILAA
jgi:nucleoside-diphosphate-sugar epimerase